MKKLLIISLVALCLIGCAPAEQPHDSAMYVVPGYYYARGEVVTEDGNIWGYSQDSTENAPVYVIFHDMGTPSHIYDDEILGLVVR